MNNQDDGLSAEAGGLSKKPSFSHQHYQSEEQKIRKYIIERIEKNKRKNSDFHTPKRLDTSSSRQLKTIKESVDSTNMLHNVNRDTETIQHETIMQMQNNDNFNRSNEILNNNNYFLDNYDKIFRQVSIKPPKMFKNSDFRV